MILMVISNGEYYNKWQVATSSNGLTKYTQEDWIMHRPSSGAMTWIITTSHVPPVYIDMTSGG